MLLCLLDVTGEGFQADGTPVSFASEPSVQNAMNSPDQQGMDYRALPFLDGQGAVLTATAFTDATGATRVLLAAGNGDSFALVAGEGDDDLLLIAQRGDVIARNDGGLIPEMPNLLDFLARPDVQGTAPSALYQAFLDGVPGVSWHRLEAGWVCLLYAPVEGTNWMAVLALPGNLANAGTLAQFPEMVVKVAGAAAILCALLLCAVLLRGASQKRRAREEAFAALQANEKEGVPEAPADAPEDISMQS